MASWGADNKSEQSGERSSTMVLRFILYSLLAYVAIAFIKKVIRAMGSPGEKPGVAGRARRETGSATSALMIRCGRCGTFVAENRAITIGSTGFCSRACAEQAPQRV